MVLGNTQCSRPARNTGRHCGPGSAGLLPGAAGLTGVLTAITGAAVGMAGLSGTIGRALFALGPPLRLPGIGGLLGPVLLGGLLLATVLLGGLLLATALLGGLLLATALLGGLLLATAGGVVTGA